MLIILNLFFGKLIFDSTRLWLGVEGVLVLLFIIKILAFTQKISEQLWPSGRQPNSQVHRSEEPGRGKVVDVEGEVVEEKPKLE